MKEGQPEIIRSRDYLSPPYLIETVDLVVDIEEDVTTVTSQLQFTRNPASESQPADLTLVGGADIDTRLIAVDDRELLSNEYGIADKSLTLFNVPDAFKLKTIVQIKPQHNTALEGLYKSGDMYCTQCEPEGFRRITWFLDRPDVLSKYNTTIKADKARCPVLLSNGNEIGRGEEGDRHWVKWQDPFNKPAYLFALVAGNLEQIEDSFTTQSGRQVTLQLFTEAHNADKLDFAMTSLKNAMAWDEQVYGREYDLDIFMVVAVDTFNMGAMENKGLNIFNTSCVLAAPLTTTDVDYQRVESVVAHEYFHNWSGNRVTCRDWFQLSLKEGFTVFREQQFAAAMGSPGVCRMNGVDFLRSVQFAEDAGPMAHSVRPDSYMEISNFYTLTVYEKGAEVVRMIHSLLGEARFRKGTDLYFNRHDGQAVTVEDFVCAMEDANEFDLSRFRRWYSQAGTPTLSVSSVYEEAARTLSLTMKQSCPPTPEQKNKQPFHIPVAVGLLGPDGKDIRFDVTDMDIASLEDEAQFTVVLNVREEVQTFVFKEVDAAPVPSLLRGFSAPVKLEYDYSKEDLLFLLNQDRHEFDRWEAMQRFAVKVIQEMVEQIQRGLPPEIDMRLVQACETQIEQALEHHDDGLVDKAMIANMLTMPAEAWLAELAEVINVDAIHQAREQIRTIIAHQLKPLLLSVYNLNRSDRPYQPTTEDIAGRALKNTALGYLMQPDDSGFVDLCVEQFDTSDNMTDTSAALKALVDNGSEAAGAAKEKLLKAFYDRWSKDALVVDQWFRIQSSCPLPGALGRVEKLMQHPAFTLKNPNRVRSLVMAFAAANRVHFHSSSGSGYRFLAARVLELDPSNPQTAARALSPLTQWRKHDKARQSMMKQELTRILNTEGLSGETHEVAYKGLND